jgi:branched-chain amino acid transport system substrate-binding protein
MSAMRRSAAALLLTSTLTLAACGSGSGGSSGTTGSATSGAESAGPATGQPIPVGAVTVTSGAQAGFVAVQKMINGGAQAYLDFTNAHGGINGRPVQLEAEDGAGDPGKSLSAIRLLAEQRHVVAFLHLGSQIPPELRYAEDNHIPVVGLDGAPLCYVQPVNRYAFADITPYEYEAAATAKFLASKQLKNVYYAGYSDYTGQSYFGGLKPAMATLGLQLVGSDGFARATTDFAALISKMQAAKPDAVVFFSSPQEFSAVLKAGGAAGFQTTWVAGPGNTDPSVAQLVGPLAEGAYGVSPYESVDSTSQAITEFKKNMSTYQPNVSISPWTQHGYIAARALVDALRKTGGDYSPDAIARALETLQADYGMLPAFQLSPSNHLMDTGVQIVQFKSGKLVATGQFISVAPGSVSPTPCSL